MLINRLVITTVAAVFSAVALIATAAQPVVVQDSLIGPTSAYPWQAFGGACLTAGDGSTSTIPACTATDTSVSPNVAHRGGHTGTLPDAPGNGALRLTNSVNNASGAVISTRAFPLNAGIQATFTTVTYLGDSGGSGKLGADGISFFLMDAAKTPNIGSYGGSLGYSCSNSNNPYTGMMGGYIGLGIDEYGNFLHSGDNTSTGFGFQPGRIGLRGAGSIAWPALTAAYGTNPNDPTKPYYPASLATTCVNGGAYNPVAKTCATAICSGETSYNIASGNCENPICSANTLYVAAYNNCETPQCTTGQYYRASDGVCQTPACGTGTYYQLGANACQTPSCNTGQYYRASANACQTPTCGGSATYQASANACQALACAPGTYYRSNVSACQTPTCTSPRAFKIAGTTCQIPACSNGGTFNAVNNSCSNGTLTWSGTGQTPIWSGNTARVWTGNAAPTSWGSSNTPTWAGTAAPTSWGSSVAPTFSGTATGTLTHGGVATGTLTYGTVSNSQPNSVEAVRNTCQSGNLFNYAVPNNPSSAGAATLANAKNTQKILNYAAIPGAFQVLPTTQPMANESAANRTEAVPITYKLKVSQAGLLSLNYSYNGGTFSPIITNQDITASNGPLPSAGFLFGFAGSTGGSRNVHEITCFQATSADQSSASAAVNVQQTAKVDTGTQVYLAYYNPTYWSGQLTSQNLVYNPNTKVVSISSTVNWDASCVLTGGDCNTTSATNMTAQGSSDRTILTWNGSLGVPFQWNDITTGTGGQQEALAQGDATPNADRLNFLRGDRSNEINTAGVGKFRARFSVLGDIINSTPTWVGPPAAGYKQAWGDALYSSAVMPENNPGAVTYPAFSSGSAATRLNVIYSGANDGLLHGFRSGSYAANGTYVNNSSTPNDGREVLAYMPGAVVNTVHNAGTNLLDYSSPQYAHNYYVDATPASGDVFYGGAWHTWLVGGLGAGGSAIYALDVTDPRDFNEANASSIVVGEWSSSTLSCVGAATCGADNLGNTYGVPQIRRFHNGTWGFIFGNGFDSASGSAGIFVATIDPTSGGVTFYYLDTGSGVNTEGTKNGIYYATPADLDGDHITDYVYAGDLLGNVWRFDLTSDTPTAWEADSAPMFSAPAGQPITSKVVVAAVPALAGGPRVMVNFGTGIELPQTLNQAARYASAQQSLYGIWDWDLTAWNGKSTTQYATLTGAHTVNVSNLQVQTILGTYNSTGTGTGNGLRTVSSNPVCWQGATECSVGNTKYGWYFPLATSTGLASPEQIIYSPILQFGTFIVNTTIPANDSPTSCTSSGATGWTMALDPATGGAFKNSFFGTASNTFISIENQVVSGIALNAVGSPSVVTANNAPYLVNQTVTGVGAVNAINPPGGSQSKRLTWTQKR